MEYKLINNLWQFLKRWKDLPMIRTDEFMADLEDSIGELSQGATKEQKQLIMSMFTDAVDYLHATKKSAFM